MTTGSSALVSLGLLRERLPGERRVALTPADVKRLSAKAIVTIETGAGREAGFPDDAYANAGAHLAGLQQVLDGSAVIAKVRAPDARGLRHRIERFVQSPSTLRRSLCPCSLIQSKSVDWTKRRSPPRTRDAAF